VKGTGAPVLYVDYDGVLHHENVLWHPRKGAYISAPSRYSLFQHTGLLEEILAPYPRVKIVLSTSWVRVYSFSKAASRLSPALRQRVVGATWHSRMVKDEFTSKPRGVQVWEDVLRRMPKNWIALDDDEWDWPAHCRENLIRTDDYEGISDPEVLAELKRKLAKMCK
jgi:hypothetical protein